MVEKPITHPGHIPAEQAAMKTAEKNAEKNAEKVADRFNRFCVAVVRRLPFGLARIIAPSFLGFALINGFTFGVDLLLLTVLHGSLGWSVPISVTLAYICAFGLSFVLNRSMNFRSHAPVGKQAVLYAIAVAINYVAFILGVSTGLTALGVEYHLARIVAGACEGIFMYSVMRWIVFADRPTRTTRTTRTTQ